MLVRRAAVSRASTLTSTKQIKFLDEGLSTYDAGLRMVGLLCEQQFTRTFFAIRLQQDASMLVKAPLPAHTTRLSISAHFFKLF